MTSPPGDPRLFVTERAGVVRIVGKDGAVKPEPFLDISSQTTTVGERGLLSIAFPPDYTASGLAYVFVTGVDGSLQIREFRRSATDPGRAEPGVGRLVLSQPHPLFATTTAVRSSSTPAGCCTPASATAAGATTRTRTARTSTRCSAS